MASDTDFLTTQKNGVVAINGLNQTLVSFADVYAYGLGKLRSQTVTATTQIATGSGRLVSMNIVVAGAAGLVHDALVASASGLNAIAVSPASVGTVAVGAPFTTGLVVAPGAGQSVNVVYSLD